MTPFKILSAIGAFFFVLILLVVAFGSWGTVKAGHRGILLRNGAVTGEIKGEGLFFKTPWIDRVIEMSVQTQKEEVATDAASKDLQTVTVHIALNLSVETDKVAWIYQTFGVGYEQVIVDPALKESAKAVIAQFTAEELITKREVVREDIAKLLRTKLDPAGIKTAAINIVNFDFSKTFNQAIEAKVTAEQNALAAKNKLAQIEFEAQQQVAAANGKAKAITIESQALQSNPQILQLRALEKWDGKMPQVMGTNALPFVNVGALAGK